MSLNPYTSPCNERRDWSFFIGSALYSLRLVSVQAWDDYFRALLLHY